MMISKHQRSIKRACFLADTGRLFYLRVLHKTDEWADKTPKKPFPCVGNTQLNLSSLSSERAAAGVPLARAPRQVFNHQQRVINTRAVPFWRPLS